jgi:hypothetical protein
MKIYCITIVINRDFLIAITSLTLDVGKDYEFFFFLKNYDTIDGYCDNERQCNHEERYYCIERK